MRSRLLIAAIVAGAVVAGGAAVAVAAGPSAPLTTSNGGEITCPGYGQAPITDDDGTVCSHDVSAPGVYYIAHGITGPKTASVTLRAPNRGFEAYRLSATHLAVTVGYPTNSKVLYSGPLSLAWSVSG